MFKLKPGNVFQKINTMDKKQAYTWGAIVVVCFIALITLASFMGDAEDASFDGFNTRGYDLAQMPFVSDEAEEYLLASKYPDMQNNGSTMLYSQAEKEARQEADAEAAEGDGEGNADSSSSSSESNTTNVYKYKGYTGGGRGVGSGTPTQVGTLGSASMGRAGGSGVSGTFGAPRGDFSPYKSQEKGSEIQYQLKNTDARKALSQFAQTSRAAAGLKDGKGGNAKKALMGGNIKGSEAFTETGVDLSKASGLELDTNAPSSSMDLSNLDKKVSDGQKKAKEANDKEEQDLSDKLLEQFLTGLVNLGVQALGGLVDKGINAAFGAIDAYAARSGVDNNMLDAYSSLTEDQWKKLQGTPEGQAMQSGLEAMGIVDSNGTWNTNQPDRSQMRNNLKQNRGKVRDFSVSRGENGEDGNPTYNLTLGSSNETLRAERTQETWAATWGRSPIINNSSLTQNNNNNGNDNHGCGSLKWTCTGSGKDQVCQCK